MLTNLRTRLLMVVGVLTAVCPGYADIEPFDGNTSLCTTSRAFPTSIAISPDGMRIYVAGGESKDAWIISTKKLAIIKSINFERPVNSVVVNRNNGTAYFLTNSSSGLYISGIVNESTSVRRTSPINDNAEQNKNVKSFYISDEKGYILFGKTFLDIVDLNSEKKDTLTLNLEESFNTKSSVNVSNNIDYLVHALENFNREIRYLNDDIRLITKSFDTPYRWLPIVGRGPFAVDNLSKRVAVLTSLKPGRVRLINLENKTSSGEIAVIDQPVAMAFSHEGNFLYIVGHPEFRGILGIVDVQQNKFVNNLVIGPDTKTSGFPLSVVDSSKNNDLFILTDAPAVIELDPNTDQIVDRIDLKPNTLYRKQRDDINRPHLARLPCP
jgi:DNA-binding beta-propeller fold protein YncE